MRGLEELWAGEYPQALFSWLRAPADIWHRPNLSRNGGGVLVFICNLHQSSRDGYGMVRREPNQLGVIPFVCANVLYVDFVQRQKARGK